MRYDKPLIIMGMGRSGTTVLTRILREHKDALLTLESHLYWGTGDLLETRIKKAIVGDSVAQDQLSIGFSGRNKYEILERLEYLIGEESKVDKFWDILLVDEKIYGDKRAQYIYQYEYLQKACPNSRYIVTLRDPRAIWLSQVDAYKEALSAGKSPDFWHVPTVEDAISADPYSCMNAIHMLKTWDNIKQNISLEYIEIKYEDLCTEPEEQLGRIASFLNINISGLQANYDKYFEPQEYDISNLHSKVLAKDRPLLAKYGYIENLEAFNDKYIPDRHLAFKDITKQLNREKVKTTTNEEELRFIHQRCWELSKEFNKRQLLVVELGGYELYTAQVMASAIDIGQVISIDTDFASTDIAIEDIDNRLRYIEDDAASAVKEFEDNSINLLYVDACHEYEHVLETLELYISKMKNNGIIIGHDYNPSSVNGVPVIRAVEGWKKSNPDKWVGWGTYERLFWFLKDGR